jgi:endonuclease/exonuclease/phosphatase (EEP) superfamily protein YafD
MLIALTCIFIISSLAPFSKRVEWWIRAFDFPYLQFTVLGFICLLCVVLFSFPNGWVEQFIYGFASVLFLYRLTVIFPYTPLKKPTIPWSQQSTGQLSILSANVLMTNDDYTGFFQLEEETNPDMLLLVEADEHWEKEVSKKLKLKYPYSILHPLANTYGMLLYSKLELKNAEIRFLVEEGVPSIKCEIALSSGDLIQFYGVHPKPPAPDENDTSTPRDAELVMIGREARSANLPVIVAGDMNDVAWSHTTRLFMRISGLLDPRMGRGFFNTFHAERPLLRWPLDHVFLSHHFRIVRLKRKQNFHSDHFPILIDVTLNPSVHAIVSKEHANGDDREEAQSKIDSIN